MRKLTLIATITLAAIALTAPAAQADPLISAAGQSYTPCGQVVIDGGDVSGGCVINASGSHNAGYSIYQPPIYVINSCHSSFELHIDTDANLYAANPTLTWGSNCGFRACETGNETDIWTGSLHPHEDGEDTAEIHLDMCVEQVSSGDRLTVPLTGTLKSDWLNNETTIHTTAHSMTYHWMDGNWWGDWESDDTVHIYYH